MIDDLLEIGVTTRHLPVGVGAQPFGMIVDQFAVSQGTLILFGVCAPWVIDAARKLEVIGQLGADWDSYGGSPLDPRANTLTVNALGWLGDKYLPVPAVVLGSAGTVQMEWRVDGRELEVEMGKDGIEFLKVDKSGIMEEGAESGSNIPTSLQGLSWWLLHG